jgi:hypothetical protein
MTIGQHGNLLCKFFGKRIDLDERCVGVHSNLGGVLLPLSLNGIPNNFSFVAVNWPFFYSHPPITAFGVFSKFNGF